MLLRTNFYHYRCQLYFQSEVRGGNNFRTVQSSFYTTGHGAIDRQTSILAIRDFFRRIRRIFFYDSVTFTTGSDRRRLYEYQTNYANVHRPAINTSNVGFVDYD